MARPSPADLLQRIESRHRDLLEQLDQLNDQVARALDEFSSEERPSPSEHPGPALTS
jgi:t-SNARE complex subunit (syntaxin)